MTPEAKAMQDILEKMYGAQKSVHNNVQNSNDAQNNAHTTASGNVSPDAREMFDILSKLEKATATATQQVAEKSAAGEPMVLAESSNVESFGVAGFNIAIIEGKLAGKYKKKYYTITKGEQVVYEELSLFESAMAIVKELTHDKDVYKVQEIARLDHQYGEYLNEAAVQKQRAKTLVESVSADVASAKHSQAVGKMSAIKKQIKKLL